MKLTTIFLIIGLILSGCQNERNTENKYEKITINDPTGQFDGQELSLEEVRSYPNGNPEELRFQVR
jgi:RPA family protein